MANIKQISELTNYEQFQMERFGNILLSADCTPEGDMYESGIEELERLAGWIDGQAELQMMEAER